MAKLYIVPTPIGNLEDITLRSINVLIDSDLVLCEDTRRSKILMSHYKINTQLKSFHKFNEHKEVDSIVDQIKEGKKILDESGLKILSAGDLNDAAKKIVEAIK